jgi:hypothetical protein
MLILLILCSICLSFLLVVFARTSRSSARVISLLLSIITLLLLLQKPWRTEGAMHLVGTATIDGKQLWIIQEHDGGGLNSTFVVLQGSDQKWKWYAIGNDDWYWRSFGTQVLPNGEFAITKLWNVVATVNPNTLRVAWHGHLQNPFRERWEHPQERIRSSLM